MEDICHPFLSGQACPYNNSPCPGAHSFSELANLDQWVTFDAPHLQMLDFLAYKYYSHPTFKWYTFPSGPIVRFASPEDAQSVISEYKSYHNPKLLTVDRSLIAPAKTKEEEEQAAALVTRSPMALAIQSRPIAVRRGKKNSGSIEGSFASASGRLSLFAESYGSDGLSESAGTTYLVEESPQSPTPPTPHTPAFASPEPRMSMVTGASVTLTRPSSFDAQVLSPLSPMSASTGFAQLSQVGHPHPQQATCQHCQQLSVPASPVTFNAYPTYGQVATPVSAPTTGSFSNKPNHPTFGPPYSGFGNNHKNFKHTPNDRWSAACIEMVLSILRESTMQMQFVNTGWQVLQRMWGIRPQDLDAAVLSYLSTKPSHQQERILLSFAAINLSNVKNLSAYLCSLIKQHETTGQVCIRFLAGFCPYSMPSPLLPTRQHCCEYMHPVGTFGWTNLFERWHLTYRDFDYTVLNYLSTKTPQQQDEILITLAGVDLPAAKNLSACLSTLIQKHGETSNNGKASPKMPSPTKIHQQRRKPQGANTSSYKPTTQPLGYGSRSPYVVGDFSGAALSPLSASLLLPHQLPQPNPLPFIPLSSSPLVPALPLFNQLPSPSLVNAAGTEMAFSKRKDSISGGLPNLQALSINPTKVADFKAQCVPPPPPTQPNQAPTPSVMNGIDSPKLVSEISPKPAVTSPTKRRFSL